MGGEQGQRRRSNGTRRAPRRGASLAHLSASPPRPPHLLRILAAARGWAPWGPAHEAPCGQAPWAAPPSRFRMLRVVPAQAFSPRFPSCWKEGLTDVSLKTSEDLNQNLTH